LLPRRRIGYNGNLCYTDFAMMKTRIEDKLRRAFSPTFLEVKDTSYLHEGHAGHSGKGESHFNITIVSPLFSHVNRVQRHRQVYDCLANELKKEIHALQLTTLCPEEGLPAAE
jgi:BolA protein